MFCFRPWRKASKASTNEQMQAADEAFEDSKRTLQRVRSTGVQVRGVGAQLRSLRTDNHFAPSIEHVYRSH